MISRKLLTKVPGWLHVFLFLHCFVALDEVAASSSSSTENKQGETKAIATYGLWDDISDMSSSDDEEANDKEQPSSASSPKSTSLTSVQA